MNKPDVSNDQERMTALLEEQAFSLSRAAIMLDVARQSDDKAELAVALEQQLELWVAIRTVAQSRNIVMGDAIRQNLVRLSQFVADTIFANGVEIRSNQIDSLININLQICEGLLETAKRR
jgi:flagellar biosynthesis regulator FlaF